MNSSFGAFRLVNTYGAFGSVGARRYEPIIQLSRSGQPGAWHELELPCKPGNVTRRPCLCAPYHHRLDWNIWFLGFKPHQQMLQQREAWLYTLLEQLLRGDESPWPLLDAQSVAHLRAAGPPVYAKVDMYEYTMAAPLWELAARWWAQRAGAPPLVWWRRAYEEPLIPVVQLGADGRLQRAPV